jgi:hypothetical protein
VRLSIGLGRCRFAATTDFARGRLVAGGLFIGSEPSARRGNDGDQQQAQTESDHGVESFLDIWMSDGIAAAGSALRDSGTPMAILLPNSSHVATSGRRPSAKSIPMLAFGYLDAFARA